MWLLLNPPQRERCDAYLGADLVSTSADPSHRRRNKIVSPTVGICLSGKGEAVIRMHPGRLEVSKLNYAQVEAQFELDQVRGVYSSLGAVEVAEGGCPGFTISFESPIQDSKGTHYERGVVFCDGLRRH